MRRAKHFSCSLGFVNGIVKQGAANRAALQAGVGPARRGGLVALVVLDTGVVVAMEALCSFAAI